MHLNSGLLGLWANDPALARARPVSRQHIQVLVNVLLEHGLVETVSNPAHQRSPLVRLTPAGRARFDAMRAKERAVLSATRLPATAAEMRAAADTLHPLREHLAKMKKPGAPQRGVNLEASMGGRPPQRASLTSQGMPSGNH